MRTNLVNDLLIRAFGIIRMIITPLILSTTEYGQLGLISAIFLYANFADMGLQIHYEIISKMDPSKIKAEVTILMRQLIPRLFVSSLVLAAVIYVEFHSWQLVFWSFVYVFTINIDTLLQIILRQQLLYKRLALALFFQGFILTILMAPIAWKLRITGLIALQALIPLISIFINIKTIKKYILTTEEKPLAKEDFATWDSQTTIWLLLGQIQMMIWITADRFFLARMIPIHELGLWNLGNMAAAVLLGFANTWGTLKLSQWKKDPHPFLNLKFILSFFGIYCAGALGLILVTHFILKKYSIGIGWNLIWFTVTFFISFIFISDSYVRSQIKSVLDARKWFIQKFIAQAIGAICVMIFVRNDTSPRASLCLGVMVSCFVIYYFSFLRIKKYA